MKRPRALATALALILGTLLASGGRVEAAHAYCVITGAPCYMRMAEPPPPSAPTIQPACCVRVLVRAQAPAARQPDRRIRDARAVALRAAVAPSTQLVLPPPPVRPASAVPRAGPAPLFLLTGTILC